jgi:putative ABC transport system ATP-binding protein/lipoprotein-releasing system ATP-binding protein
MGIVANHIGKEIGKPATTVLSDISLAINDREFVAILGRSGSGKSTLLYLLSTLDRATSGSIEISGQKVQRMSSQTLHRFRNQQMGFVFQFHYLIAELSMLDNIVLPARKFHQVSKRTAYAKSLIEQFGLAGKEHRLPRQLSGGEQQRVAIARALLMQPAYLFADEPTGNLDSINGELVMKILMDANKNLGTTILMVTHDPDFAGLAQRQIHLVNGRVEDLAGSNHSVAGGNFKMKPRA